MSISTRKHSPMKENKPRDIGPTITVKTPIIMVMREHYPRKPRGVDLKSRFCLLEGQINGKNKHENTQ